MDDSFVIKLALRLGAAMVLLALGVGAWKATHRASPYAVPAALMREFSEIAAVETGHGMADGRGLTPQQLDSMLYASVGNASPAMVAWLLQQGANPRVDQNILGPGRAGRSALQLSAARGRCVQAKLLIDRVGELAKASASGSAEAKAAAAAAETIAFVNERDATQRTVLHDAVLGGDRACVAVLLAAGARVDAHDAAGATPLDVARAKLPYLEPILAAALAAQGGIAAVPR